MPRPRTTNDQDQQGPRRHPALVALRDIRAACEIESAFLQIDVHGPVFRGGPLAATPWPGDRTRAMESPISKVKRGRLV